MLSGCRNFQESQSSFGSEYGNTCEHQRGRFPQGQQQQNKDQRKCGPTAQVVREPCDKGHRSTQCLLHLSVYWYSLFAVISGTSGKVQGKVHLFPVEHDQVRGYI